MRIGELCLVLATALTIGPTLAPAAAAVEIEWVTVGDPGNDCDPQIGACRGSVAVEYRIGRYEVTNAQYSEFLNAVAKTDTHGLYNPDMSEYQFRGGIERIGDPGSFEYFPIAGRERLPVNLVSFWDAARFANWLDNGQPVGAQDETTTEDGAYTLLPDAIASNTVVRNTDARIFLPSDDEWYKAAYYDPSGGPRYYLYPTGKMYPPTCQRPSISGYGANCQGRVFDLTEVGSYTNSPSPIGTYDQGGNVAEWTELNPQYFRLPRRGLRGGDFFGGRVEVLAASSNTIADPTFEFHTFGFRVAAVAERLVDIDIAPGSDLNLVDPLGRYPLLVAVLGAEDFDVTGIDAASLAFGPDGAPPAPHRADPTRPAVDYWDVDDDGFTDLIAAFQAERTGIAQGDALACLSGELADGTPTVGCDSINTLACGIGFELAFLLPPLLWSRRRANRLLD